MTQRLVDRFAVGAECQILLASPVGEIWVPGRVTAHAHPGIWVATPGGRWFVTNGKRIEENTPPAPPPTSATSAPPATSATGATCATGATTAPSAPLVCKILRPSEWETLDRTGVFTGSPDDLRDGYVHLSTPEQVPGSLAKHFAGVAGVVVADVDPSRLPQGTLRWQPSRGGALFPHLYAALPRSAVVRVRPA